MFAELEKSLDAGWDGYGSVHDYPDFLYKEVTAHGIITGIGTPLSHVTQWESEMAPKEGFRSGRLGGK